MKRLFFISFDLVPKTIQENHIWDAYYKKDAAPKHQSSFATFVLPYLKGNDGPIMELGCGNGRDSFYFLSQGLDIFSCDLSIEAVEKIKKIQSNFKKKCNVFQADFANLSDKEFANFFAMVYSRFTLHAIEKETASKTLAWSSKALRASGLLAIEARSVNSSMYGQGTEVGRDEFINGHYRRFIRKNELEEELLSLNFNILYSEEVNNVAILNDDNPVVVRIVAQKNK